MIDFVALKQLIIHAREAIPGLADNNAIVAYDARGVSWRTFGLYAYVTPTCRLVVEGLHSAAHGFCAIRTYREDPFTVLYGRKWAGDLCRFERACLSAAEIFSSGLPATVHLPPARAKSDDTLFDKFFGLFAGALNPIPPPCNPDLLEDA